MCTPLEAYMKAIDKSRFMKTLPPEDAAIADSGGGVADGLIGSTLFPKTGSSSPL